MKDEQIDRHKDQAAVLPFLSLPPEIRNMIYTLLLTPKSGERPDSRVTCHPAILACCKLVNAEAADLLYQADPVPLDIKLHNRPIDWEHQRDGYGVAVYLNERLLTMGKEGHRAPKVRWPSYLARLRSVRIYISLWRFRHRTTLGLDADALEEISTAGEMQLNKVLYDLHCFLGKHNNLQQVLVTIFSDFSSDNEQHEQLLSPVCALSGEIGNAVVHVEHYRPQRGTVLTEAMQSATDSFRKIHSLMPEAKLEAELGKKLISKRPNRGLWPLDMRPRDDALSLCQMALSARLSTFYIFPDHEELAKIADSIEVRLDEEDYKKLEHDVDMTSKLEQLKQMRISRKAEAKMGVAAASE